MLNSIYLNCQYSEDCKIYAFKNWDNGFLILVFWFVVIRRWNFITSGRKPPLSRGEFFTKKPSYRSNEEFMKSGRSGKSSGTIFTDAGFTLLLASLLFFFFSTTSIRVETLCFENSCGTFHCQINIQNRLRSRVKLLVISKFS